VICYAALDRISLYSLKKESGKIKHLKSPRIEDVKQEEKKVCLRGGNYQDLKR
jgi:hypothetical protein